MNSEALTYILVHVYADTRKFMYTVKYALDAAEKLFFFYACLFDFRQTNCCLFKKRPYKSKQITKLQNII